MIFPHIVHILKQYNIKMDSVIEEFKYVHMVANQFYNYYYNYYKYNLPK